MKRKIILSLFICILAMNSCTNLEEDVLDEALTGGTTAEQAAAGSIAPVYAVFTSLFLHTNYFALQEISTDEAILPYRGGTDWGDNGIYLEMHRHTYTPAHSRIRDAWKSIVIDGVTRSIIAMNGLASIDDPSAAVYLAEARAMRAYYSLLSLDVFGVVFVKDDPTVLSKVIRGNEAVEYIEQELLTALDGVSTTVGPGRITKGAVWGLLARLHLNAAVYRNIYGSSFDFTAEDMDKVIEYTTNIISSSQYQLSPEYFEIFDDENHTNKELIFAVDQRADLNGHNRMAYFSLSGDQYPLPQFPKANGTDGPGITSDFYQTWVEEYGEDDPATKDPRFFKKNLNIPADSCMTASEFEIDRGILRGQQYGIMSTIKNGSPFVRCGDDYKIGKLRSLNRGSTALVNFTEQIDFGVEGSGYSTGYRVSKYEFGKKSESGRNYGEADIVILRLADVYLMRAEAKLRKSSPDAAGALQDVNAIRAARTARIVPPPLPSVTLETVYRERGFELYWEMVRRTDMIRFGKYEDTWTEKSNTDVRRRLFPIPQSAIDGASSLPGFLVQNDGY